VTSRVRDGVGDARRPSHPEERLRALGLELPAAPPTLAHYAMATRSGNLLFLAGHAPLRDGELAYVGKVGREFTLDEGYAAARLTALNMLATLRHELGDLARVQRILRLFGMVNCTEDFVQTPDVIDGASDLFVELWGDAGLAARSAVGMQQLHYGMAIEIEGTFEITNR
jgi:enamine deaminase RidA (YjgF/YER057c/UK114 family)